MSDRSQAPTSAEKDRSELMSTVSETAGQARRHWRKRYWTPRWRAIRAAQLQRHPLCCHCLDAGQQVDATVCDHVEPHRGDVDKFWSGPFQSLCKPHHDSSKQRAERQGYSGAVGDDGFPIDPLHPANSGRVPIPGGVGGNSGTTAPATARGALDTESRN